MSMILRNEVVALGSVAFAAMTYWTLSTQSESKLIRAQSGQCVPDARSSPGARAAAPAPADHLLWTHVFTLAR